MNWKGWLYLLFPLGAAIPERPLAGPDGVIQYPLRWDALLVVESARQQETEGVMYLTGPMWISENE